MDENMPGGEESPPGGKSAYGDQDVLDLLKGIEGFHSDPVSMASMFGELGALRQMVVKQSETIAEQQVFIERMMLEQKEMTLAKAAIIRLEGMIGSILGARREPPQAQLPHTPEIGT
jgi:hypothetical protein